MSLFLVFGAFTKTGISTRYGLFFLLSPENFGSLWTLGIPHTPGEESLILIVHATTAVLLGSMAQGLSSVNTGVSPDADHTSLIIIASPEGRSHLVELTGSIGEKGQGLGLGVALPGHLRPLFRTDPANEPLAASLGLDRMFVLEGLTASTLDKARHDLMHTGWCETVSLNHTGWTDSSDDSNSDNFPNDPLFNQQYALHNTGQLVGGQVGRVGADVRALEAWHIPRTNHSVTVAVFDAGLSESHPDIAPRLVPGWDFQNNDSGTDDKYTSHGTHCAGIISAVSSNREGITGLAWNVNLMPIVVLNKFGFGNTGTLTEAIVWTADQGVDIASISIGYNPTEGDADDLALHAAVQYATQQGMLICASSGNVPSDPIGAPARYPETMAIGATDNRDNLWGNTSTGPEMIVVAPGVNIVSTWDSISSDGPGEDTYHLRTGTSQAAPHVAGLAALLLSINPTLEQDDLRLIIERTAQNVRPIGDEGWTPNFGHGRINAAAAARDAYTYIDRDLGSNDNLCTADFNGDGVVNSLDFIEYLTAYDQQDRRADLAAPFGTIDIRDLLAYLSAYAEGCE